MLPHARLIALVVTVFASLALLVLPAYSGSRTTTLANGQVISENTRAGLIAINGSWVVGLVLLPVAVALVPLIFPRLKIPAAALMLLFCLIGSMSIGLFYTPSAILLFWPERPAR